MGQWFATSHAAQLDVDSYAGRCQHPDQSINAEELDLPSNQIADPWLRNSEQCGRIALSESFPPNRIPHSIHQLRAESQMRCGRLKIAGATLRGGMKPGPTRPIHVAPIARFRHGSRRKGPSSIYKP
jgi:hypothetical protein